MVDVIPPSDQLCTAFGIPIFHDCMRHAWTQIHVRLNKRKIHVSEFTPIGRGSQGRAYRINEKTVLKITDDESEAHASRILQKHPSPYFVKVRDVFAVEAVEGYEQFCIVQDLLVRADDDWRAFASRIPSCYITPRVVERLKERHSDISGHMSRKVSPKYTWLTKVAAYLNKHKIKYKDLHEGNIMKKGKYHKVIDLGYSKVKPQPIDVLPFGV